MTSVVLKRLLAVILGLAALPCAAAPDTAKNLPTISQDKGQPFTFSWSDGREAVLKISHVDSGLISSTFKIVDNTCSDRQNMTCQYKFGLRRYFAAIVWTKNPEPSRVGTIVQRGYDSQGTTYFETLDLTAIFAAGLDPAITASLGAGLPVHEMTCSDFSWLPGGLTAAPASLHMDRWDGEDNLPNPETGANENRTTGGAFGIDFVRSGPQTLKVAKIAGLTGISDNVDILNLEPTASITMRTSDGEICQAGLSSNSLAELTALVGKLEAERPSPAVEKPYIIGSDGFLTSSQFKGTLKSWLKISDNMVYK